MKKPKSEIELLYEALIAEYPISISLPHLRKATSSQWKTYTSQIPALAELERKIRWDNQERKKRQSQYLNKNK